MHPTLLEGPSGRGVRRAKALLIVSTLLLLLTASSFASVLLTYDSARGPRFLPFRYVEKDGDWMAYATVGGAADAGDRFAVQWDALQMSLVVPTYPAYGNVERVFLTRGEDVDLLLAGQVPRTIFHEWEPAAPFPSGVDFEHPGVPCAPPDACEGEAVVIVWLHGDAWEGTSRRSFKGVNEGDNVARAMAPLAVRYGHLNHDIYAISVGCVVVAILSALTAVGSAGAWWLLARRAPSVAGTAGEPLQSADPSEMLRVARLAELYVVTITRYFVLSGAFILFAMGLVMALALPPLLETIWRMFLYFGFLRAGSFYTFVGTPPFVAAVAGLFWVIQLREARRELARWRRFRQGLDEQAAAILAA